MKLSKPFLLVVLVIIFSYYAAHAAVELETNIKENATNFSDDEASDHLPSTESEDSQLGSVRRLLFNFQSLHKGLTCNKYPRVCRRKGSAGPDCCKKKCVDVERDRNNCGRCGKKCKYSKICCKGKCVNPLFNRKHCGGCNNGCRKGRLCVYGMCGYA